MPSHNLTTLKSRLRALPDWHPRAQRIRQQIQEIEAERDEAPQQAQTAQTNRAALAPST
ncbi:hypothetical protein [Algiphilus aromaticivorans]|uniref:hypothetical protein n=1 Tax=Algiphilus aromaticivorans TaxID=382454 RepID=UPI0012EC4AD3|nr:hypothetical protein [Algiphilus aromaticivorans]